VDGVIAGKYPRLVAMRTRCRTIPDADPTCGASPDKESAAIRADFGSSGKFETTAGAGKDETESAIRADLVIIDDRSLQKILTQVDTRTLALALKTASEPVKDKIYDLLQNFPYLSDVSKKVMVKYMDQFYDIISDPKQVIKRIYDACEIKHKHLHEF